MKLFADQNFIATLSIKEILDSIEVRLIAPEEKIQWDELMSTHHYLGFGSLIGEGLRYVASYKGYWLALLGWSSAALHCGARDKWINWSSMLRKQRLFLIANNTRFLILPSISIKNLASKILALNIKRLSQDWQERYNHPIVLAETFVDPRYFKGVCYNAAGWMCLGETRGFSKSAKKYTQHNNPKKIWVKIIHKQAKELFIQPILPSNVVPTIQNKIKISQKNIDELRALLGNVPDVRTAAGKRHNITSILVMAIYATLCGARSTYAITDWLKACPQDTLKLFRTRYDTKTKNFVLPSEPTLRRTLKTIDGPVIDNILADWISSVTQKNKNLNIANQTKQIRLLSIFC